MLRASRTYWPTILPRRKQRVRARRGSKDGQRTHSLRVEALEERIAPAASLVLSGLQTLVPATPIDINALPANPVSIGGDQAEMSIAVNPVNPLNVAAITFAGGLNDVYSSQDGGVTWRTTTVDSTVDGLGSGNRFDPSIAFDSLGGLYIAYGHRGSPVTSLVVARSFDGGGSFPTVTVVDSLRNPDTIAPRIDVPGLDKWHLATGLEPVTGREAVYVAYTRNVCEGGGSCRLDQQIRVAGSRDGGLRWRLSDRPINDESLGGGPGDRGVANLFAHPAIGPDGELYVSWHDRDVVGDDSGRIKIDRDLDGLFADGSDFGDDVVVARGEPMFKREVPAAPQRGIHTGPVLDVDKSGGSFHGRLYIAYASLVGGDDTDIKIAFSDDDGGTWTQATVDASPGSTEFLPWVDVDQTSGAVNVIYYTTQADAADNDDVHAHVATSIDGGATWPAAQNAQLSTDPSNESGDDPDRSDYLEYIGLTVHDGTIHGLWAQNSGIGTDLEPFTTVASFDSDTDGNALFITSTSDDTEIMIRMNPVNRSFLEVRVNDDVEFMGLAASLDQIWVFTADGDDELTVDFQYGNPLAGIHLNYFAGRGDDVMRLESNRFGGAFGLGGVVGDLFAAEFHGEQDTDRIEVRVESGADLTLTDERLFQPSSIPVLIGSSVELSGVEQARLNGDSYDNDFDASTFTAGPVTLSGGDGRDTLRGGSGDDRLDGGFRGGDFLAGGPGNDYLGGSIDDDTMFGGPGNDELRASTGADELYGEAGNDTMDGGTGDDTADGGDGDDTFFESPGSDDVIVDPSGRDTIDFSFATRAITLNLFLQHGEVQTVDSDGNTLALNGNIERVIGSRFDDTLFGNVDLTERLGLELFGRGGNDRFLFDGTPLAGSILNVFGEEGDDEFRLSLPLPSQSQDPELPPLLSVSFDGGKGADDRLVVFGTARDELAGIYCGPLCVSADTVLSFFDVAAQATTARIRTFDADELNVDLQGGTDNAFVQLPSNPAGLFPVPLSLQYSAGAGDPAKQSLQILGSEFADVIDIVAGPQPEPPTNPSPGYLIQTRRGPSQTPDLMMTTQGLAHLLVSTFGGADAIRADFSQVADGIAVPYKLDIDAGPDDDLQDVLTPVGVELPPPNPPPGGQEPINPPKVESPPPLELLFDGSDGTDTVRVTASDRAELIGIYCGPLCITQMPLARIVAENVDQFSLNAAGGNDDVTLLVGVTTPDDLVADIGIDLQLGAGNDRLRALLESAGLIAVPLVANLRGGAGDDVLMIDSAGDPTSLSVLADGGPGDDFIQGSDANEILLGGDGNDQLHGGAGRDLLIESGDQGSITGGSGDDILVPGTTAFDSHSDQLRAIHGFWSLPQVDFIARVRHLSGLDEGPQSHGPFHLIPGETVFDDGVDNSFSEVDPAEDWLILPCFVTNTADSGPGSLREAIHCANAAALPGQAAVSFRIPQTDPNFVDVDSALPGGDSDSDAFVIAPVSELPPLDNEHGWGIILDGRTQTRFGGDTNPFGPEIVLVNLGGITEPPVATGLRLFSNVNRVFELNIQRFAEAGIRIEGSGNWLAGNYIGSDPTGRTDRGNGDGVHISGGTLNYIGTNADGVSDAAERNLISANARSGIIIAGDGTSRNLVLGNYIGTDVTGTLPLGNFWGIEIIDASMNFVQVRNVISANHGDGIYIRGTGASGNLVNDTFVGTDVAGTRPLPNGRAGVRIEGAPANRIITNVLSANAGDGVFITGPDAADNLINNNAIGTDLARTHPLGNALAGVHIDNAPRNRVVFFNVIFANGGDGVRIAGPQAVGNHVSANAIGTSSRATGDAGNALAGVRITDGAHSNLVGSDGDGIDDEHEGNTISGNGRDGVAIVLADGNVVAGNDIGFDRFGRTGLGNGGHGVSILGGAQFNRIGTNADGVSDDLERNVIAGNRAGGVEIRGADATGNVVAGNYIGVDVTGRAGLGNCFGVYIVGGASNNTIGGELKPARNVISGNVGCLGEPDVRVGRGVEISGPGTNGNQVLGNYIGVDVTGSTAIPNRDTGVTITASAQFNQVRNNVISGNGSSGLDLFAGAAFNVIAGNYVGIDAAGTAAIPNVRGLTVQARASHNIIGTDADGKDDDIEGNVISGNRTVGLIINGGSFNVVAGNIIGLDARGSSTLPNEGPGVFIGPSAFGVDEAVAESNRIGGRLAVERNLIAGNTGDGVRISGVTAEGRLFIGARDNVVAGNIIKSNSGHGVHVVGGAERNRIGTDGFDPKTDAIEGNEIVGNLGDGVRVIGAGTVKNSIRGNSINTNDLLGIDLGGDGVTANDNKDPDAGPNQLQNYPVLKSARIEGTGTRVRGQLKSLRRTEFTIDFYASPVADPTGHGEGERWLGSFVVMTNAGGVANFNALLSDASMPGEFVTATATEQPAGNTSEFSAAVRLDGGAARARAARSATTRATGSGASDAQRLRSASNTFELSADDRAARSSVHNGATKLALVRNRRIGSRDLAVWDRALALETDPHTAATNLASPALLDVVSATLLCRRWCD